MMKPIKKKKRKSFLSLTIMFVISALWLSPVVAETEIEKCFKNPDDCTLDMPNQDNLKSIEAAKQSINDVQTNEYSVEITQNFNNGLFFEQIGNW